MQPQTASGLITAEYAVAPYGCLRDAPWDYCTPLHGLLQELPCVAGFPFLLISISGYRCGSEPVSVFYYRDICAFTYDDTPTPDKTTPPPIPKENQQRYVVYVELNDGTTKIIERCPDKKKAMDFVKKFKTKEIDKIVYKLKYRKED